MIPLFRNGKSILLHQQSASICHRAPEVWAAVLRAAGNCWNQLPAFQSWPNQGPTDTTAQRPAGPPSHPCTCLCWVCCCFTNSCSQGARVHSSSLPVITPNILKLNFASSYCFTLCCFHGDPTAPVLLPSLMLQAIQGVAFDPEARNDLDICLLLAASQTRWDLDRVHVTGHTWAICPWWKQQE